MRRKWLIKKEVKKQLVLLFLRRVAFFFVKDGLDGEIIGERGIIN